MLNAKPSKFGEYKRYLTFTVTRSVNVYFVERFLNCEKKKQHPIMKRNFKQQGSIIFTNINKTNEHKKDHDIDVGNLAPTLGDAQHYGVVKPVNEISTLHS